MKDFFNNISSQMNDLTQWLHITSLPPKVVNTIHQRAEERYNHLNNDQKRSLSELLVNEETNLSSPSYDFFQFNKELIDCLPFPEMISYLLEDEAIKITHEKLISLKELKDKKMMTHENVATSSLSNISKTDNQTNLAVNETEVIDKTIKSKTAKPKQKSGFDLNKISEVLETKEKKEKLKNNKEKDNKKVKFSIKKKDKKLDSLDDNNYSNSELNIENIGLTLNDNIDTNKNKNKNKNKKSNEMIGIQNHNIESVNKKDEIQLNNPVDSVLEFRKELNNEKNTFPTIDESNNKIESIKIEAQLINNEELHHKKDTQNITNNETKEENKTLPILKNEVSLEVKVISEKLIDNDNYNPNYENTNENITSVKSEEEKQEVDLSIPDFLLKSVKDQSLINTESEKELLDDDSQKDISHDRFKEDMKEKRRKIYNQANGLPDIKAKREKFKLYQQQKESMYKQAVFEFLKDHPKIFEKYGKENLSWEELEKMIQDSSKSSE